MIIIDTNFFVALFNTRDKNNITAKNLLKELSTKEWGLRIITDYIIDETVTMLWTQTHNKELVTSFYKKIALNKNFAKIEKITTEDLNKAWELWKSYAEYPKRPLSFTDCTILAMLERLQFSRIVSFDAEFKGLVEEIII